MKNVDKARVAKMVVAFVLLVGLGVAVVVAMNLDTGNEVGMISQGETSKDTPRDDSNGKKAEESRTEPKGVTTTEQSDDNESERGVVHTGGTGFSYVRTSASTNTSANSSENLNSGATQNSESGTAETEAEKIAREEAERVAREEAERVAREEAERIARIEQMIAAGTGVYSGVYTSTNSYPWESECPRGDKVATLSVVNGLVIGGYQCECVSYAAWMVYQEYGVPIHWGSAHSWDEYARAANYRVDNTPAAKAVGQIDTPPYGHVFWVESVNSDGSINVTEYNNPQATYLYSGEYRFQDFGGRTISAQEAAQYNYIHFEDLKN